MTDIQFVTAVAIAGFIITLITEDPLYSIFTIGIVVGTLWGFTDED